MTELVRIRLAKRVAANQALTLLGCFEDEAPRAVAGTEALRAAISRARRRAGFDGRSGQRSEAEIEGRGARLVVLHGLGRRAGFDRDALERWIRRLGGEIRARGSSSAAIAPPDHGLLAGPTGAEPFLRRLALLDYRFDDFRESDERHVAIDSLTLVPAEEELAAYREAARLAAAIAAGVATTRDLANTPPNVATPAWMAARAQELARATGMKATVLGPRQLERRRMGGILAVGGGSANGPRLVRLEWGSGPTTVSLVGKGVTFDTGGISIKPAAAMDEMKYDKSGACTVLGIARAVALLELPLELRCYLPLAENMPDGAAYRPGDIVRCFNGKTVEILNTDAEGRMILADALAWAAREAPRYLIDYATLTGACVVALGRGGAGLFSPDDDLAAALLAAAESSDERLWRLPLWPEFGRQMKGVHADLRNSGGRWGGASTAAAFLSRFVDGAESWAHVDIAGPAYLAEERPPGKGATGYGVGLTVHWLRSLR